MKRLENKVSLITGAAQGIGLATALKFAAEGAIVIVCDVKQVGVDAAVAQCQAAGATAAGFVMDVTDRAMVDAFHAAALAHGGRDHGAPGERPYHPGYYAAFVLDPDGNNIEAVYHGEAERSADSVVVTFAE